MSDNTTETKKTGLRIWLKDYTQITAENITVENITIKDGKIIKDGKPLDDVNTDDIIGICKDIQEKISTGKYTIISSDVKRQPSIFSYWGDKYTTRGYVGVIIDENDNQIFIGSRFDNNENQWFLQYVFSKAFDTNGKIFENMTPTGKFETTWDFLIIFMFMQRLKEAFRKGIFRKYRQFLYNDSHVKGQIDIARYIKLDIPENGKIAYRTREYTPDNYYNILFLRALDEMEKKHPQMVRDLLAENPEVKKTLSILKNSIPEWNTVNIQRVLKNTEHRITHSVYRNYEQLRVISRIILKRLGFNVFTPNREKAMGVVIHMPTLWEKFLEKTVVRHSDGYNSQYKTDILDGKQTIRPDFYLKDKNLVLDAKYRNSWTMTIAEGKWNEYVREDVFQVMAYMLSLECKAGGVICPYQYKNDNDLEDKKKKFYDKLERLSVFPDGTKKDEDDDNRYFFRLPYFIPNYKGVKSYKYFADKMEENAEQMVEVLEEYIKKINP